MKKDLILKFAALFLLSFGWSSVADAQYVASAVSDGCIATSGSQISQKNVFSDEIGHLEKDAPIEASIVAGVAAGVSVTLAQEVVRYIFDYGESFIKSKAEDTELDFDDTIPTYMFKAGPSEFDEDSQKIRLPVNINPSLRCYTVVINKSKVDGYLESVNSEDINAMSPWEQTWSKGGPPKAVVLKRLHAAKLVPKNGSGHFIEPIAVFEVALLFSEDGAAAKFLPRYFRAFGFSTSGSSSTRSLVFNITLDSLENISGSDNMQVVTQSFSIKDVRASNNSDSQTVSGISTDYGYGPEIAPSIFDSQGWVKFYGVESAPFPEIIKSSFSERDYPLDRETYLHPINVRIKAKIIEEASEVAVFLSNFVSEHQVSTKLSSALIEELSLLTSEEEKERTLSRLDEELENTEYWKEQYSGDHPDATVENDANLKKYVELIENLEASIDRLKFGCDPVFDATLSGCN